MERTFRKKLIVGAVAFAALLGGGGAIAASQLGSDAGEQAILNDAAEQLGVEPSALSDALKDAYRARVDAAVEAGELSEEQGEALKERIEAGDVPLVGGPFLHGHGHGFRGLHGLGSLDAAATYLGLTEAELRTELESGKTLAEIAAAEGKSADGLAQALLAAVKEELAQAVEGGRITETQQQEMLESLPERIKALVQGELPGPHGPGLGGLHGPGFGGHHGPGFEPALNA